MTIKWQHVTTGSHSNVLQTTLNSLNSLVSLTLLDDADATAAEKKLSASSHLTNVQSVRHGIVQMNSARCWEQDEDSRTSNDLTTRVWI